MSAEFTRIWPDAARGLTAADVAAQIPGPPPDARPFVAVNMIATADGRATIHGRTGPIANPADYELFHALRARADAVMVGAATVRVEGYGPMDQLAVLVTRTARVPADAGLARLRTEYGVEAVLCEGGPHLFGDLLQGGMVDELHLVIAPKLAAGHDPLTIVSGDPIDPAAELALRSVHESGGYLFLRYAVGLLE